MNIHNTLAGQFTLLVQREGADGALETVRTHEFPNLITNLGLDRMGAINGRTDCCVSAQVGSGSTTPAFTDTQLAAFVAVQATRATPTHGWNAGGDYHWRRFSWQFAQGAAAGNLAEVGVGTTNAAGALWSRALILDANGQPTTITILPTEFLTIVYELRNYPPTGDVVTTATIDGVLRTITMRPCLRVSATEEYRNNIPTINYFTDTTASYSGHIFYPGDIGPETGEPSGSMVDAAAAQRSWEVYVPGSYARTCTTTCTLNQGNVTGGIIRAIVFSYGGGKTQMGFNPGIAKNNMQSFKITTRVSWGRHTP